METSGILTNLYVPDHVAVLKCYFGNEVVKPEFTAGTQRREFDENINGNAT